MKLLWVETIGYKRLAQRHIERFVMTPVEKIQWVLGTNGSGKSSLVSQITPLPANKDHYRKDGRITALWEHRNVQYRIKSDFAAKHVHSFIIRPGEDEEQELNPGGTASVQKDLAKKYFNMAPDVQEILLGNKPFTSMGPSDRRQWFTRLADTDFNFAIQTYQKLKDRLNTVTQGIKINQVRSVQEANKLLTEEQEVVLREEVVVLNAMVGNLLTNKPADILYTRDIQAELTTTQTMVEKTAKELLGRRTQLGDAWAFNSVNDIDDAIIEAVSQTNTLSYRLTKIAEEIESQQGIQQAMSKNNLSNLEDIATKIEQTHQRIATQSATLKYPDFTTITEPQQALQALETVEATLADIFVQLESNEDRRFTRERYISLTQENEQLSLQSHALKKEQDQYQSAKNQQEQHQKEHQLECPSCHHQWYKGYDAVKHAAIVCKIAELVAAIEQVDKRKERNLAQLEEIRNYMTLYKAYTSITQTWPILKFFWDFLLTTNVLFHEPRRVTRIVSALKLDLVTRVAMKHNHDEIVELTKLQELTKSAVQSSIDNIGDTMLKLNGQYADISFQLRGVKEFLIKLKQCKETVLSIGQLEKTLQSLVDKQTVYSEQMVTSLRKDAINKMIQIVQLELSRKEQQLSQVTVQKAIVQSIQTQLTELQEEQEVLKMMVTELSPTEGLIAKGLRGFINTFIRQMNTFIKRVWVPHLMILPCEVDENNDVDLNYKFRLQSNDSGDSSDDVNESSTAQKEIINLAWRIVFMKYMGLSDSPLVLDEFAASFDVVHRFAAMKMVSDTLSHSEFTQIFMISHYKEGFGSLKNAQVCVLDDSNLMLPKDSVYNQHVIIS